MTDGPTATQQEPARGPQSAKQTRKEDGVEYVVLLKRYVARPDVNVRYVSWEDIATVTVPKRSQTPTIVLAALKESGVKPSLTDRFRVLDGKAARELSVMPKEQPAPEYEVALVVDGERRDVPEN